MRHMPHTHMMPCSMHMSTVQFFGQWYLYHEASPACSAVLSQPHSSCMAAWEMRIIQGAPVAYRGFKRWQSSTSGQDGVDRYFKRALPAGPKSAPDSFGEMQL
eukprot:jgi/Chrzof1/2077/Cz11g01300.t1